MNIKKSGSLTSMNNLQCIFCGGKGCKYENYSYWLSQNNTHSAIRGLFSNWVTDDILATARPSSRIIEEFDIIKQFQNNNIKAIINLQLPGEHALCGDGITKEDGFSYFPEEFMNKQVFYYNFGWKDMSIPSLELALNAVQVIHFTIKQGYKIAIHCHAGLGRTGMIIACYLVYRGKMWEEAIQMVRQHRPNAVQTSKQCQFVLTFWHYLKELQVVFALPKQHTKFTFEKALKRQRRYLHGIEEQTLRFIPKICHVLCIHLYSSSHHLQSNRLRSDSHVDISQRIAEIKGFKEKVNEIKKQLNHDHWEIVSQELNPWILLQVLWDWFEHLKSIGNAEETSVELLDQLPKAVVHTLGRLLGTLKTVITVLGGRSHKPHLFTNMAASLLGSSSPEDYLFDHKSALSFAQLKDIETLGRYLERAAEQWRPNLDRKTTHESTVQFLSNNM